LEVDVSYLVDAVFSKIYINICNNVIYFITNSNKQVQSIVLLDVAESCTLCRK